MSTLKTSATEAEQKKGRLFSRRQFIQLSIDKTQRIKRRRKKEPVEKEVHVGVGGRIKERFRDSNYCNDHVHPLRPVGRGRLPPRGWANRGWE